MWFALFAVSVSVSAQEETDDRRVVYVRNAMDIMKDCKRSELWIVESNGTDHRKLTGGTTDESSPRWSPDGAKLIYISKEEGTTQIFLRWMESGPPTVRECQPRRLPVAA